eukprot:1549490-Amphidinium_carterae.1
MSALLTVLWMSNWLVDMCRDAHSVGKNQLSTETLRKGPQPSFETSAEAKTILQKVTPKHKMLQPMLKSM